MKQVLNNKEIKSSIRSKINDNFTELYSNNPTIIFPDNDIDNSSWWTADTTYLIKNDFDFEGLTVNLPLGVVLLFNGGVWSNGVINGANSIFTSYGFEKCFETDLTLIGTWNVPFITPQHYGAKCNVDTSVFDNDCTAIIQKCIDSLFTVFIPAGFYYITSSLIINSRKCIICDPHRGNYSDGTYSVADHTHIYTDQDIDVLILRHTVIIDGGVIDINKVPAFTHSCIYLDVYYHLHHSQIRMQLFGSLNKLRTGALTGCGVYSNGEITDHSEGETYGVKMDLDVYALCKGVYLSEVPTPFANAFSIYDITGIFESNKQDLLLHTGEICRISGFFQAAFACNYEESLFYAIDIKIRKSTFDIMMCDYGEGPVGGFYTPQRLYNGGLDNKFIGNCISQIDYFNFYYPPYNNETIDNPLKLFINFNASDRNAQRACISAIDNQFAYFQQKITGSKVVLYDGEGYDFDANLDDSTGLPAATNLRTALPLTNINNYRLNPCVFTSPDNNSKLLTDFLEIVIPIDGGNWYGEMTNLNYFISGNGINFKRIQTILKYSAAGEEPAYDMVYNNYPPTEHYNSSFPIRYAPVDHSQLVLGSIDKIIIRFIGSTGVTTGTEYIIIHDIYSRGQFNFYPPLIDIGGGQIIYGNLSLSGGIPKLLSQAIYADNATAKAGGLIAGDTYRTATGQLMVVYD